MERIKTHIEGFDDLIQGGIPKNSNILISGPPGTLKTIFCLSYIYYGAKNDGKRGLYITFEQSKEAIIEQGNQLGFDIEKYRNDELIFILSIPAAEITKDTVKTIFKLIEELKIERVVLDSLSTLSINMPMYHAIEDLFLRDLVTKNKILALPITEEYIMKRFIYYLLNEFTKLSVTTLMISEIHEDSKYFSSDMISEFLCDGVIQISYHTMGGEFSRSLIVRKMRHTKNNDDIHPVEITDKGIIIHSD